MKQILALTLFALASVSASAATTPKAVDSFLLDLSLSPAACQPFVVEWRSDEDWKTTPDASDAAGPVFRLQNTDDYFRLLAATSRTHYVQAAAAYAPTANVPVGPDLASLTNTVAFRAAGKPELAPASRGGQAVGDAVLTSWANAMLQAGRPGPVAAPMFAAFFWCR